jgi:hypothetical protein
MLLTSVFSGLGANPKQICVGSGNTYMMIHMLLFLRLYVDILIIVFTDVLSIRSRA